MDNKAILAVLTYLFISFAQAWIDGYHQDGDYWRPWHYSWKTCSNSTVWETCEKSQFLSTEPSTNGLWVSWDYGEYYDTTVEEWRLWNGSCNDNWRYQSNCLECPPDEILDLNTFTWVPSWGSETKFIESDQLNLPSIWRGYDYYVDPFSEEVVELGTKAFPYKSLRPVISEIINFFSHSEANINIYTKDIYVEDDTAFFLNISSVSLYSHPDYTLMNKRARIVVSLA